jgi:hypothetical protein
MKATYASMQREQQHIRDQQIVRYNYTFPLNIAVPYDGDRLGKITVDEDADFYAIQMTGKVIGPADQDGKRLVNEATDFPQAGTILGFADSGLQVRIFDAGSGYDLSDGLINVETILTPGYGLQFHIPFSWKYYVRRNSTINYEFTCRDQATPLSEDVLYQYVSLSLNGYKYTGNTK